VVGMPNRSGEPLAEGGNPGRWQALCRGAAGESQEGLLFVAQAACSVGRVAEESAVEHPGFDPDQPSLGGNFRRSEARAEARLLDDVGVFGMVFV
jgi:hypothetical protein